MRFKLTLVLVAVACALSAQEPSAGDRYYQAIRNNDLGALRALVKQLGVNAKDSTGQTPLVLATAFGTTDAMEVLLDGGASAAEAGAAGVAPLHATGGDVAKVRLLLARGADVHARTQLGKTPLMVAASSHGTLDAVRMLIAAGANVTEAENTGVTPLMAAARADDTAVAKLLIAKGANVDARAAGVGQSATAVMAAAYNGNAELVRLLLAGGAKVDPVSREFTEVVKNGRVEFGNNTALHLATLSGNADVVKLILDAGAAVDPLDVRGTTPLLWAVATDRAEPRLIRLLLAKGANPSLRSKAGESAADWARKYNNPAVLAELKISSSDAPVVGPPRRGASSAAGNLQRAAERTFPLLRTASSAMMTKGGCVACHAQPITAMALGAARDRGWRADFPEEEISQVLARLSVDMSGLLQGQDRGGFPDTHLYSGMMLAALRVPAGPVTDALVHYLAGKQKRDGNWQGLGGVRPPLQDGNIVRTALAIRTIAAYAIPARRAEFEKRVAQAAAWLAAQTQLTTTDRAMQLLGLKWADAQGGRRTTLARELIALQRADGGWAQTPHTPSDAFATGQVIYALRATGAPASDPAIKRGIAFLLDTQREDGSWHVKSRALPIQPYFESGFPYEHDQWISHPATAWAAMALTVSAEPSANAEAAIR